MDNKEELKRINKDVETRILNNDKTALADFIMYNQGLLGSIAIRLHTKPLNYVDLEDLKAEAVLAVYESGMQYTGSRGTTFVTYISGCIIHKILKLHQTESRRREKGRVMSSLNKVIKTTGKDGDLDVTLMGFLSGGEFEEDLLDKEELEWHKKNLSLVKDKLTPKDVEICEELFIKNKNPNVVAKELNISRATVNLRKRKMLSRYKKLLIQLNPFYKDFTIRVNSLRLATNR